MRIHCLVPWLLTSLLSGIAWSEEIPNLNTHAPDLVVPTVVCEAAAAGHRVAAVTKGWEGTEVRHALYLPRDWRPGVKLPVLVEYAGNGGFRNVAGDVSDGTVGSCVLGYGLSGGEGFILVSMPFVEVVAEGTKRNCTKWWGDVGETKRYCVATVRDVCARYGGDASRVVLCGFSRGAIACNYIGLNDDDIAGLWRAFFATTIMTACENGRMPVRTKELLETDYCACKVASSGFLTKSASSTRVISSSVAGWRRLSLSSPFRSRITAQHGCCATSRSERKPALGSHASPRRPPRSGPPALEFLPD